jgi:hypothetical protein
MTRFIEHFSYPRSLWLLLGIFLFFNLIVFPQVMQVHQPLDLRIGGYTGEEAYAIINSYGPEGRKAYKMGILVADMLYPFLYALLLSALFFRFSNKRWLIFLPWVIAGFDYMENSLNLVQLSIFPDKSVIIGDMAGLFTQIKWILIFLTLGSLAITFGIHFFYRQEKSKN